MAVRQRAQGGRPRVRAVVVPLPRPLVPRDLRRFVPSRRSLVLGVGLLAVGVGAYVTMRQSSAFAVTEVEVSGVPPAVQAQVRQAVQGVRGTSLLALDGAAVERRVETLPAIVSATYDRDFPHRLRIAVVPERPVAVLRRGKEFWLLSARGRVLARLRHGAEQGLPRVWVPTTVRVMAGVTMPPAHGLAAAQALALASRFPARVELASLVRGELTFRLRSGLVLLLGAPNDIRLKLAIARRALEQRPAGTTYLDVSLPQRPVAGSGNPQLSSGGLPPSVSTSD